MRRIPYLAGVALAVSAGLVQAQTPYRPLETRAAPAAQVAAVDPVQALSDRVKALQSRTTVLEHKLASLQATVSKTQPTLNFRCLNQDTSINSAGVSEVCDPFGCGDIDGRCRTTAKSSADCALGYVLSGPGSAYGPAWCVVN